MLPGIRHCQNIVLDLRLDGGAIILCINDDGKEFDISGKPDGNGLENMKNRAASNSGSREIESKAGNGTNIKIRFPEN